MVTKFSSLSTVIGNEQSRRDDLESVGLIILYLLSGELPWERLPKQIKAKTNSLGTGINKKVKKTVKPKP